MMNLLAATLDVMGTVLIGWAALRVHHRVLNEHKIDKRVFRVMRLEQKLGAVGILLVVLGFVSQIIGI